MDDIYYEPIEETNLAELLLEDIRHIARLEAIRHVDQALRTNRTIGCLENER